VRVRVLFFGMLKDIVGKPEHLLELAEGSRLDSVFEHFAGLHPRLNELRSSIVLARNQQFSSVSAELADGDEVALLPPVSGGSASFTHAIHDEEAGHFFALTRDPIDVAGIERSLLRGEDGAVVTFQGVARNNTKGRATRRLDYECYEPMAIQVMAGLGREIAGAHAISRIAMVHRLGRMEIGETSVAIVVTAPHRKPAFEAALEGINRLKRTVPIWKKEHFADGEIWVEGEWDSTLSGQS
jgi:molybdopterin synthase catalytic subunit